MENLTNGGAQHGDATIDSFIKSMQEAGPVLTPAEMDLIANFWEEGRRARRCCLAMLLQSPTEIAEAAASDRGFAVAVAQVQNCSANIEQYRALVGLLERSSMVALFALAGREDMEEIIAEAEADADAEEQAEP